jgi:hypothetical protein
MVQVYIKKKELEEPLKIKEVIIFEELPAKEEEYRVTRVKAEEKPVKKALFKLIEKAKYNPKYLEETNPIKKFKRDLHRNNYRNFGLF